MFKTITKLALLGAFAIQFSAFAGGQLINTTWNPSTLFVKATNGAITNGNFTITSQLTNPYFAQTTTIKSNYTSNGLSVLGINNPNYEHIGNSITDFTTSVIGYTIDLTGNSSIETITGFVRYTSSDAPTSNLPFTIITEAGKPFITEWNLATAGSGATQLTFDVETAGVVSYSWETYPMATATGVGTFTGTNALITGLPTDATIRLSIDGVNFQRINVSNTADQTRLIDIAQWGTIAWTSMERAFLYCQNLQISATDIPNLSGVTNMSLMFASCSILNSPTNIGSWNTSNVTNMYGIFSSASAFNQPVGGWNITNVTNMGSMFSFASAFNQSIGGWNTANVLDMSYMFQSATSFNQPIGTWNTTACTNMRDMFNNATDFNQSIGGWNTSNVTNISTMFRNATAFNQPIGNWDTKNVVNLNYVFDNAIAFNQSISGWDIAAVTSMKGTFQNASTFNQNLGAWGANLRPGLRLTYFLNGSGLSVSNYEATLQGFATSTVTNLSMNATGLGYCDATFRNILTSTLGLNWTISDAGLAAPTSIVTQPISQTVCGSNVAEFVVSADGLNLNYAWSNGLSTTTSMLTSIAGTNYIVTISGTCGAPAVSSVVGLTVNAVTNIVTQPISAIICGDNLATFSVSATGTNLMYTWSNGATANTMNTSIAGTNYIVSVSGACGNSTSNTVSLTVNDCTPLITVTSVSITGFTVSASLTSITSPILVSILGSGFVNGATVTIGGVVLSDVLVSGNVITGTIAAGSVIIDPANPSISIQNPNQTASVGVSVTPTEITIINSVFTIHNSVLSIYPNPNTGSFSIDAPNYEGAQIINLLGEVIQTVILTDKTQVYVATKGFYLVRLYSNTDSKLVKINVE